MDPTLNSSGEANPDRDSRPVAHPGEGGELGYAARAAPTLQTGPDPQVLRFSSAPSNLFSYNPLVQTSNEPQYTAPCDISAVQGPALAGSDADAEGETDEEVVADEPALKRLATESGRRIVAASTTVTNPALRQLASDARRQFGTASTGVTDPALTSGSRQNSQKVKDAEIRETTHNIESGWQQFPLMANRTAQAGAAALPFTLQSLDHQVSTRSGQRRGQRPAQAPALGQYPVRTSGQNPVQRPAQTQGQYSVRTSGEYPVQRSLQNPIQYTGQTPVYHQGQTSAQYQGQTGVQYQGQAPRQYQGPTQVQYPVPTPIQYPVQPPVQYPVQPPMQYPMQTPVYYPVQPFHGFFGGQPIYGGAFTGVNQYPAQQPMQNTFGFPTYTMPVQTGQGVAPQYTLHPQTFAPAAPQMAPQILPQTPYNVAPQAHRGIESARAPRQGREMGTRTPDTEAETEILGDPDTEAETEILGGRDTPDQGQEDTPAEGDGDTLAEGEGDVQTLGKRKRDYNQGRRVGPGADIRIEQPEKFNFTLAELICFIPELYKNWPLLNRFLINGLSAPDHADMERYYRFSEKEPKNFLNTIATSYRATMRKGPAPGQGITNWTFKNGNPAPQGWDHDSISMAGFKLNRDAHKMTRQHKVKSVPLIELFNHVRRIPEGEDAADLTNIMLMIARLKGDGVDVSSYMLPDHLLFFLEQLGPVQVGPGHSDARCLERHRERVKGFGKGICPKPDPNRQETPWIDRYLQNRRAQNQGRA